MGPDEDLDTLVAKRDHINVLRYIRCHQLREPALVLEHGKALLGSNLTKSLSDATVKLASLEQICLAALDIQDHTLADRCLDEISKSVSKEAGRFRRLLARCLESAGATEDALKIYEDLVEDNPANVYALKRKYCILRSQPGKEPEAMEALNAALEQNPSDTSSWNEMARIRLEMGDYKGAAYSLEEVLLGSPLDASIHCRLAEVYATLGGLGNLKLARKHMAQSLELDDSNSNRRALFGLVAVASSYLEQVSKATKKGAEDADPEVAKEIVKYGGEKLLKMYKGTKLFAAVQAVVDEKVEYADKAVDVPELK